MAEVTAQRCAVTAVLVAVGVLLLAVPSAAQHVAVPPSSSAPAPAGIDPACLNSLLNMSDCLPYVQAGSAARWPEKACCPELAGMVGSDPVCLCALLSGAADSYGIAVDYSRALALPGICRVSTPPITACAAMGYNVTAGPSAAPAPAMAPAAVSPSGDGPQLPAAASPAASSPSHATRRLASAGGLLALAAVAGGLL